jgi:predicted ester cyclase
MKRATLILLLLAAASASAAVVDNKVVARRIFDEILTHGRFERTADYYAPDFVNHGRTRDVALSEDQAAARGWLQAFPDLLLQPEVMVLEGDLVAIVWHGRGTNTGAGNGLPATGRRIEGLGITVWRFAGGKVTEEWSEFSRLALLQQLGLVPGGSAAPQPVQPLRERAPRRTSTAERDRNRAAAVAVFEHSDPSIETIRGLRQLAPDLAVTVTKTVAEGDLVAVIYTASGTNTGAALGYPATGRSFRFRGMSVVRFRNGKIADEWSVLDQYQALEQFGLLGAVNNR